MARTPAPPGPPPPNYRPPGTPPSPAAVPLPPRSGGGAPPRQSGGIGPGAATAVAVLMLLVGVVAGFFLGRAYDDGSSMSASTIGEVPQDGPRSGPSTTRPPGDTVPPESPASPPSTDLPRDTIGTHADPVPAGQAYVLGLYEIEVRDVRRDATQALVEHHRTNPPPPPGQQHLLVELAVRFTDPVGLGNPASIPFFVSDGTAQWSAFDATCGLVPGSLREAGLIGQGDEAVGQVCFTVPTDAVDQLALGTESFSGPLYFALP